MELAKDFRELLRQYKEKEISKEKLEKDAEELLSYNPELLSEFKSSMIEANLPITIVRVEEPNGNSQSEGIQQHSAVSNEEYKQTSSLKVVSN